MSTKAKAREKGVLDSYLEDDRSPPFFAGHWSAMRAVLLDSAQRPQPKSSY